MKGMLDRELFRVVKQASRRLCTKYHFSINDLRIMSPLDDLYGKCLAYAFENNIRVDISAHKHGRYYDLLSLLDTVAHESAHVVTKDEKAIHSGNWKRYYKKFRRYLFKIYVI